MRFNLTFPRLLAIAFALVAIPKADAAVVVATSFEQEAVFASVQYTDTGDPSLDHALANNPGEPILNSTVTGKDLLGFTTEYINTRNSVGLTDGDFVGVTDFVGTVGAFSDGDQGFQFADSDGMMRVNFDSVDITGLGNVTVSLDAFIREEGWESSDLIRIYATVDGTTEVSILDTTGSDIDDLGIEGAWTTYSTTITGSSAVLSVEVDSNAGTEEVYIDNVVFEVTAIPEPGMASLLAFGVAGLALRRRRS